MLKEGYEVIENYEEFLWWHRARREIIIDTITKKIENYDKKKLLDIGCGSGELLSYISKYVPNCIGLEPYEYPDKKYNNIFNQPIFNNNLKDNSFDIITFFNVMEHIEDENKFLNEVKRLINKLENEFKSNNDSLLIHSGGYILITVPAYQWLWTNFDVICKHYRRYNIKRLKKILLDNGFVIEKISYFNFLLFPAFALVRIFDKIFNKTRTDYGKQGIVNTILYKIFSIEKYLLRKINLPFGSSILCLCKYKKVI